MFDNRLNALDATFLHLEDDVSHMHVTGVQTFRGAAPSLDEVREHFESRLDVLPRYRQRAKEMPFGLGRPRWVDDPHFNLAYHVRHTALPAPGDRAQLDALTGRLVSQQLNRNRPLWEFWFVEGLEPGEDGEERFAVITKQHHAMVDGVASVDIMSTLFDDSPEPDEEPGSGQDGWRPDTGPGDAQLLAEGVAERAYLPEAGGFAQKALSSPREAAEGLAKSVYGLGAWARSALRPAPSSPYNVPIGPDRRVSWTRVALDDIKAVKDAWDGTVNDVVMSVVAGAVRRHLQRRGERLFELKAFVPVSVRAEGDTSDGNQVSGIQAPLPIDVADPHERFTTIHAAMEDLKTSGQALGAKAIIDLSGFAAPNLLDQAVRLVPFERYANLVVTNVPGPQEPLYLLGREMTDIAAVVPLNGSNALGVAIISYAGGLNFCWDGDWDAVPDLADLPGDIDDSLAELMEAAGVEASRHASPR